MACYCKLGGSLSCLMWPRKAKGSCWETVLSLVALYFVPRALFTLYFAPLSLVRGGIGILKVV